MIKAEVLIEKLNSHSEEFKNSEDVKLSEVGHDCKLAAETLKVLKTSKHTQKRARNRLSKENKKLREQVKELTKQLQERNSNEK